MSLLGKTIQLFSKPTPKGLLGISLRQNSIAYCQLAETGDKILCDEIELIANDYSQTLTKLLKQHEWQGECRLVLSTSQYNIIQIDRPDVPEEEIAGALKWQIKDLVPCAPENMLLDYFYAPAMPDGTERLYVVCTPLDRLKPIVEQLNSDKVKLTTITIEEFAFAHLLPFSEDAQLLVCQQPNEEIFILIVRQGRIVFHRQLRGFAQLGEKTSDELSFGLIDNLSLEIQKSTDYFERQLKQPVIKAIKVLIPTVNENLIVEKLAANTNVAVTLLPLAEEFTQYRHLASAIGATISPPTEMDNLATQQVQEQG